MLLADLIQESHETAVDKGWWEGDRSFGDQMANFHAELSEAWEEYRVHGLDPDWFLWFAENGKPEGIAAELADVLIRIADTCGKYRIPLEEALVAKLQYNKTRSHRHGDKRA